MARTNRPILDAASGNVLVMIAIHQDRPCPSNREIMEWTAVPRRRLAAWMAALVARGIIEIERRGRRRRMRAPGMPWTGWSRTGGQCNGRRSPPSA